MVWLDTRTLHVTNAKQQFAYRVTQFTTVQNSISLFFFVFFPPSLIYPIFSNKSILRYLPSCLFSPQTCDKQANNPNAPEQSLHFFEKKEHLNFSININLNFNERIFKLCLFCLSVQFVKFAFSLFSLSIKSVWSSCSVKFSRLNL